MNAIQILIAILLFSGADLLMSPVTTNAQVTLQNQNITSINSNSNKEMTQLNQMSHINTINTTVDGQLNCLVTLWNHRRDLDISPLVSELGMNLIWSHDEAYNGQAWEDTHMFRLMQIPGVDYVLAKVERAAWGWTHDMSVRHAQWVAIMSKLHPEIIGIYLNDFYDEVEDGYRTEEEWREIIAAVKAINPDLQLWAPHYPHRDQGRHAFDFEIDTVILNLWGNDPELLANAKEHIEAGLAHHPDRNVIAGLYLHAGMDGGRWLTEEEFRFVLGHYVDLVNEGKLAGLRIFSAYQFLDRPEYIEWAKDVLSNLNCK